MESWLSGLHSLCLSGSPYSGLASIRHRIAMLGLFDFGILTCFSFLWEKDYSFNNQGSIGYSRTFCKCYRISSWLLEIKKTDVQWMGKTQLRNCSEKEEDISSTMGGSFQNSLPQSWTDWLWRAQGCYSRAVSLHIWNPKHWKVYKNDTYSSPNTEPSPLPGPEIPGEARSGVGTDINYWLPQRNRQRPNRCLHKMWWEQSKDSHICWGKGVSEKTSEGSLIFTHLFTRSLCKTFTSKRICLQHFMV